MIKKWHIYDRKFNIIREIFCKRYQKLTRSLILNIKNNSECPKMCIFCNLSRRFAFRHGAIRLSP